MFVKETGYPGELYIDMSEDKAAMNSYDLFQLDPEGAMSEKGLELAGCFSKKQSSASFYSVAV